MALHFEDFTVCAYTVLKHSFVKSWDFPVQTVSKISEAREMRRLRKRKAFYQRV